MLKRAAVQHKVKAVVVFFGQGFRQISQMLRALIIRKIHRLDAAETQLFQRRLGIARLVEHALQINALMAIAVQRAAVGLAVGMLQAAALTPQHDRRLGPRDTRPKFSQFPECCSTNAQDQPPIAQRAQKPPKTSNLAKKDTSTTQPKDNGRNTFQPMRINWS